MKTCKNLRLRRGGCRRGFSMVEVALALGVAAFALLSILALLPLGVKSNQISSEETKAAMILTLLESDLRNTHPALNAGKSAIYGLVLPYEADASGTYFFNPTLTGSVTTLVNGANTTALDEAEKPVAGGFASRQRYQVSVIYEPPPATAPLTVMQARLVVSWPSLASASISPRDLTDLSKVSGFLDTVVSFPAP